MERIVLLMTTSTYKAAAFLEAAARLGLDVTVGSDRPQALELFNPAGHLTLDFHDADRGSRALVAFARARPVAAFLAADDEGAILAATAARALGLRHAAPEAVVAARDKHLTRLALARAGLRVPAFTLLPLDQARSGEPAGAKLPSFPCVVKPLALSASRGVMRVDDEEALASALARLSTMLAPPGGAASGGGARHAAAGVTSGGIGAAGSPVIGSAATSAAGGGGGRLASAARQVLVESYIPGAEVVLEGILTRGRLKVLAIFDKPDPLEGPFFEETIYTTPSRLPAPEQEAIVAETRAGLAALGLDEGPIHAELRLNETGAWILEIAPRSIGGLCSRSLRFDGGRSLEEMILMNATGRDIAGIEREPLAAGVMMIPIPEAGTLRAVGGLDRAREVSGIEEIRITIPPGDPVAPPPEGSRYLGFIFSRAAVPAEVEAALREAHRRLTIEIA